MKKLVVLLATVIMVVLFAMSASAKTVIDSGECGAEGDNVTWVLYDDGELVIDGAGAIKDEAFFKNNEIKRVTICDNITEIGADAFNQSSITSVNVGNGVVTVGASAFSGCHNLTDATFGNSVTVIDDFTFWNCDKLINISIGNSVTSIGDYAFRHCESLIRIDLPDCVTTIGDFAFYYCGSLTSIDLLGSIAHIGSYAFAHCNNLSWITISDSVKFIDDSAFRYCSNLADIYYTGTRESWNSISIGEYNTGLSNAAIHFNENSHIHKYKLVVVSPTCISGGSKTFTCTCGDTYTEEISATNHANATTDLGKAPTTIEVGYTSGKYCPDCKTWIEGHEEIPMIHTHSYSADVNKNATCTTTGTRTYTCTCGDTYTEAIPPTNHANATSDPGRAPTETEVGYTAGKYCPDCKVWLEGHVEISKAEAHTHSYTYLITKTATCTTSGTKVFTCTCGDTYTESIPATNHPNATIDAGEAPTETEVGYTVGKYCPDCKVWLEGHEEIPKLEICQHTTTNGQCNKCKAFVIEEGETYRIEYTGLSNGLWYTESDIVALEDKASSYIYENGNFYYHLYVTLKGVKKGTAEVLVLDARGFILAKAKVIVTEHIHMYDQKEIPGTCIAEKEIQYTCTCGDKRSEKCDKDPLNHTGNQKTINQILADCINEGYTGDIYCEDCNVLISEGVKKVALGHDFVLKTTVVPTCAIEGSKVYDCSRCEEIKTETFPATNHANATTDAGKAPTTTEVGYTAGKYCPDCKIWIEGHEEIPMLHSHVYSVITIIKEPTCMEEGVKKYICDCGESYTTTLSKVNHTYASTITKEPTCDEIGKKTFTCICGESYIENIPVLPHELQPQLEKGTLTKGGMLNHVCKNCNSMKTIEFYPLVNGFILSDYEYTYNGKAKTPDVTVKDETGEVLVKGRDYTVKYDSGRKNPGKYAVTVTFKGNYEGEKTLYFSILPGKTSKITATQSTSAIKLTWKKVTGATGYRVYQYNSKTGKYKTLKTLTGTSYTVKNLKAGTSYKFAVKAYSKDNGETLWASSYKTITTATKPATPTVKAAAGSKKATISWNKVTGATGYVIYMQDEFGDYEKIGSTKNTSYTKKSLKKGKTYYFRVRAYKKVDGTNIYGGYKTVKVKVK